MQLIPGLEYCLYAQNTGQDIAVSSLISNSYLIILVYLILFKKYMYSIWLRPNEHTDQYLLKYAAGLIW